MFNVGPSVEQGCLVTNLTHRTHQAPAKPPLFASVSGQKDNLSVEHSSAWGKA